MNIRRIVAITTAGAIVAGGAGVAIGATGGETAEQEVLADAAKRLDTTPQKLRDALAAARDAQIDRAVKAGRITQEQADRMKAARERSGRVLGGPRFGGSGAHHRGGPGMGGAGIRLHRTVAEALGISAESLHTQLHSGKSIADVAEAEGKSLASLKTAVRNAVRAKLGEQVDAGRITQGQADQRLDHLEEHLARLDQPGFSGFRGRRGPHGPPPATAP